MRHVRRVADGEFGSHVDAADYVTGSDEGLGEKPSNTGLCLRSIPVNAERHKGEQQ